MELTSAQKSSSLPYNVQSSLATTNSDTASSSAFDILLAIPAANSASGCPACDAPDYSSDLSSSAPATNDTDSSAANQSDQVQTTEEDSASDSTDEAAQENVVASLAAVDAVAKQTTAVEADVQPDADSVRTSELDASNTDASNQAVVAETPTTDSPSQPHDQAQPVVAPVAESQSVDDQTGDLNQALPAKETDPVQTVDEQSATVDQAPTETVEQTAELSSDLKEHASRQPVIQSASHAENDHRQAASVDGNSVKNVGETRRGSGRERPAKWYERDATDNADQNSNIAANSIDAAQNAQDVPANAEQISQAAPDLLATEDASGSDMSPVDSQLALTDPSAAPIEFAAVNVSAAAATAGGGSSDVTGISELSTDAVRPTTHSHARAGDAKAGQGGESNSPVESSNAQVDLSRAEKARLVQRVARSFSRIGPSGGDVKLRLHPPELGALAVQVRMEGKSMTAKLTTESHAAREVIMESLPQLRSRLAEQGYDVAQFTVEVASDGTSLNSQLSSGQGGQSDGSTDGSRSDRPATDLRRASYLRRQLDAQVQYTRPVVSAISGRGLDLQA